MSLENIVYHKKISTIINTLPIVYTYAAFYNIGGLYFTNEQSYMYPENDIEDEFYSAYQISSYSDGELIRTIIMTDKSSYAGAWYLYEDTNAGYTIYLEDSEGNRIEEIQVVMLFYILGWTANVIIPSEIYEGESLMDNISPLAYFYYSSNIYPDRRKFKPCAAEWQLNSNYSLKYGYDYIATDEDLDKIFTPTGYTCESSFDTTGYFSWTFSKVYESTAGAISDGTISSDSVIIAFINDSAELDEETNVLGNGTDGYLHYRPTAMILPRYSSDFDSSASSDYTTLRDRFITTEEGAVELLDSATYMILDYSDWAYEISYSLEDALGTTYEWVSSIAGGSRDYVSLDMDTYGESLEFLVSEDSGDTQVSLTKNHEGYPLRVILLDDEFIPMGYIDIDYITT